MITRDDGDRQFEGDGPTALVRTGSRTFQIDTVLEGLAAIASGVFQLVRSVDDLRRSIEKISR